MTAPTTARPTGGTAPRPARSVFAGVDVGQTVGLALRQGSTRPVFDDDAWDLTGMADAHRAIHEFEKVWDFTAIANPAWRSVAKDVIVALLAPRHERVLALPAALRTARSPRTCHKYLEELATWFNWLTARGTDTLAQVTQELCEEYLEQRSWSVPDRDGQRRRLTAGSMAEFVRSLQVVAIYGDLFLADRYRPGFVPWQGRTPNMITGRRRGGENSTPTVPDELLQPLLANCLYLSDTIGPQVAAVLDEVRAIPSRSERVNWLSDEDLVLVRRELQRRVESGTPLPQLDATRVRERLQAGRNPDDPLLRVNQHLLVRQIRCGAYIVPGRRLHLLRPDLEAAVARVGVAPPWGRDAALVPHGQTGQLIRWADPFGDLDLKVITGYVATACLIVTAAVSGMRNSELLELVAGCRREGIPVTGVGRRFRLASRLIKHQRLGGVPDEWVVAAEVDRAVALTERITGAANGEPLFGNCHIGNRYLNLRRWLTEPFAARLGLAALPDGPVNARMLRRTLAVEMAKRPGGLLAAKIHLRHVSVVTTEGYANRPGGSQALFRAEVEQLEHERNLELTVAAFRDYQAGVMPAGPGARPLIALFARVDTTLGDDMSRPPVVLDNDRRVENLLRGQARTLHVGAANYCWFSDPSKALCLKLAGTPGAQQPLVGMCDSARCPQATHHRAHRPVWDQAVRATIVFLGGLGRGQRGERQRLQSEVARAQRIVDEIDAACPTAPTTEAP